jgi:hypothetical protein
MHGVLVFHPSIDEGKRGERIRDRADPDIVALEGLDEGLGHAVAFRAFDRGEARGKIERQGDLDGLVGGEDRADIGNHCTGCGERIVPKRRSMQRTIMSRIISPEMPAVVATQPIASRSWQSRAKATRTTSPFQQANSSVSEHQRQFERIVATWPSCWRGRRRPVWRSSRRPCFFISR